MHQVTEILKTDEGTYFLIGGTFRANQCLKDRTKVYSLTVVFCNRESGVSIRDLKASGPDIAMSKETKNGQASLDTMTGNWIIHRATEKQIGPVLTGYLQRVLKIHVPKLS